MIATGRESNHAVALRIVAALPAFVVGQLEQALGILVFGTVATVCCFLANRAGSLSTVWACCNFVLDMCLRHKLFAARTATVGSFDGLGVVLDLLVCVSCNQLVAEKRLYIVEDDLVVTAFGWVQRFVSDGVFEEVCQAFATVVVAVTGCFEALVSGEE